MIFHIKILVTKHEFRGLLILKSQHPMLPNLTWNETWNDTSLKKQVTLGHVGLKSFLSHSYLEGLVVAGLDNSSLILWYADQIINNR